MSDSLVSQLDWGTVPDWLAGGGTLLTVAISLGLAFTEVRKRRETEALLIQERLRARKSDASGVVAWLDVQTPRGAALPSSVTMFLQNSGSRPVFSIEATPCTFGLTKSDQKVQVPVLGPGVTLTDPFEEALEQFAALQDLPRSWVDDPAGRFGFRLTFRDSDGVGWERTLHGDLFEIPVENVDALLFDPDQHHFTHLPWARPRDWRPTNS